MDPNKIGQLDPKLKEAYDRVMKTTVTPPVSQSQAPMQSAQTMASSLPPAAIPAPIVSPTPATVSAESQPASSPLPPSPTIVGTQAPTASKSSSFSGLKAGTLKAHKAGSVPKILWITLAVVFFIAYTLLWTRVLGVSLPFLP